MLWKLLSNKKKKKKIDDFKSVWQISFSINNIKNL